MMLVESIELSLIIKSQIVIFKCNGLNIYFLINLDKYFHSLNCFTQAFTKNKMQIRNFT